MRLARDLILHVVGGAGVVLGAVSDLVHDADLQWVVGGKEWY
jgi:hypothetical protein